MEEIKLAVCRFENAVAKAWQYDTEDIFNYKNRKATREAYEAITTLRDELYALIETKLEE